MPEHLLERADDEAEVWPAHYKKVKELGNGSFGEVYEAIGPDGQKVALKVLTKMDKEARKRFEIEVQVQRKIDHPNVMKVLDFGHYWYAMPLAVGSLRARAPELLEGEQVQLAQDIARGLGAVHAAGYLHRDISPGNILYLIDDSGGARGC